MPLIDRLYNHTVRVYREPDAEDSRDEFGHVEAKPFPIGAAPTALNARPDQIWEGSLGDPGAGEQQRLLRRWFLHKSLYPVLKRDVLSVTGGIEAGALLRVEGVTPQADLTGLHHIEVNVSTWEHGELGDDES